MEGDEADSLDSWMASAFPAREEESEARTGQVVGDFRLVRKLGHGGMGQVWAAEQLSLGRRPVAVKFVRPDRVTPRHLELFAREARAGGRLSHPGIVTVLTHGESDGLAWIAMELVQGGRTLRELIDEMARAPEVPANYDREVARLVAEVATAMQVAHDAGIVHRDLKPRNILLTPDGHAKVTDFGMAQISDESALTTAGEIAGGTTHYMSPEQLSGDRSRIGPHSDVFALGVVLYELLALQRPFQGDTHAQIAAQILHKDQPDPRTLRSRIPRDLAVIAGKALEKPVVRRYASMAELAADLRRFLADEPILAKPPTRLDRAVKWVRRNPAKSAAAAIAGTAFVVVSSLSAALYLKSKESEERGVAAEESATRERAAAAAAIESQKAAEARAQEVLRLSAIREIDGLETESKDLWPMSPDMVPRYDAWLATARTLTQQLPTHTATLAELRAEISAGAPDSGSDSELGLRWWADQLAGLVERLQALSDPVSGLASEGIAPAHGWGIGRRRAFALARTQQCRPGTEWHRLWEEAIQAIAQSPDSPYGALTVAPAADLLPLGTDPSSGLWEFAHLASGEPARRGPDGTLLFREDTGIVLVLVPGGSFHMGAQSRDRNARNFDERSDTPDEGPVHEVGLSTFYLSKYEMSQGQWLRLSGANPSQFRPDTRARNQVVGDLRFPVETVSWYDCDDLLKCFDLELPTEAQWEYAARAGTEWPWWTGEEKESLDGAVNLADRTWRDVGDANPAVEVWFTDGYHQTAPVDSFLANPFGLHNVHGNVWEWCHDVYESYQAPVQPGTGLRADDHARVGKLRTGRGGYWAGNARFARSALRDDRPARYVSNSYGVRPARHVE